MKTLMIALAACLLASPALAADTAPVKGECLSPDQVTNRMTVPELYTHLSACIREKKQQESGYLFYVLSSYAAFDYQRVPGDKKNETLKALGRSFEAGHDKADLEKFTSEFAALRTAPDRYMGLCSRLLELGPPDYDPAYLTEAEGAQTTPVDIGKTWLQAISMMTPCPVDNLQLKENFKL